MTAEPRTAVLDTGAVDAENPWPGLAAFREADSELFFGRDAETAELARLVLRERVSVLFGLSGLGKTSLLQAGLFPRLRPENILPVSIRLDFSSEAPLLSAQVLTALTGEASACRIEAPAPLPGDTLWELFHRQDAAWWSPRNKPVTPLLVFDQLEEIFTLGRRNPQDTGAFLDELADLAEGRPPAAVKIRLDEHPEEARGFAFNRHPYKILLCLREDFVAELEGLRGKIRSVVHNRVRLKRMHGRNALEVVTRAGRHLVDEGVEERIVHFVAGRGDDEALESLEIEPALLSVVCRELNLRRRREGLPHITAGLLQGSREDILADFYERSVADLGPEIRTFIEDRLLTRSGFRDSVALESALEIPGVTQETVNLLTDRRLLRIEDRGGQPRLELTHDVLTGVIRARRDIRRQEEERQHAEAARREAEEREHTTRRRLRRSLLVNGLMLVLLVGVIGLAVWGFGTQRKAKRALAGSYLEKALALSGSRQGLAWLATAVQTDPDNVLARSDLAFALIHTGWPLTVQEIVQEPLTEPGSRYLATWADGQVHVWDFVARKEIFRTRTTRPREVALGRSGHDLLLSDGPAAGAWDLPSGRRIARPPISNASTRWTAIGDRFMYSFETPVPGQTSVVDEHTGLWDPRTGRVVPDLPWPTSLFADTYSIDGRWYFQEDRETGGLTVHEVATGRSLSVRPPSGRELRGAGFRPDGKTFFTLTERRVDLLDLATGRETTAFQATTPLPFEIAAFASDGSIVALTDKEAQIWTAKPGGWQLRFTLPKSAGLPADLSADGRWLLISSISRKEARLCDLSTGATGPAFPAQGPRFAGATNQVVAVTPDRVRVWRPGAAAETVALRGRKLALIPAQDEVLDFDGARLQILDARTGRQARTIPGPVPLVPAGLPVVAPGGRFALTDTPAAALVWDLRAGRVVRLPRSLSPYRVLLSPDGRWIAREVDAGFIIQEVSTGRFLPVLSDRHIRDVQFGPGDRATIVSAEGLTFWNLHIRKPIGERWSLPGATALELSPDGRRLAVALPDRTVQIFDAATRKILMTLPRQSDEARLVRFDASNRLLLTASDETGRLWDAVSGTIRGEPFSLPESLADAVFSPDGSRLLLREMWETVALVDTGSGRMVGVPWSRTAPAFNRDAQFSSDGQRVHTLENDAGKMSLSVWDVPSFSASDARELASLAEAVSGYVLDDERARLVELPDPSGRLNDLRRQTADAPFGEATAASLIRWFLADPAKRPRSPLTPETPAP